MSRILSNIGLMLLLSLVWGCGSKTETSTGTQVESTNLVVESTTGNTTDPTIIKKAGNETKSPIVDAVWTMDLKQAKIPKASASGKIHGAPFKPDRAELDHGVLTLRQGKDFFADMEIRIFLFGNDKEVPEGKSFEVSASDEFANCQVLMQYKASGQNLPVSENFSNKYALKLELGKLNDDQLPGKIYLCLPDASKSFLAGAFHAQVLADPSAKPGPKQVPFVTGKIDVKGKPKDKHSIAAGYAGQTTAGMWQSNNAGYEVELGKEIGGNVTSTTFAPRNTNFQYDAKEGGRYSHVKLSPGRYLVYAKVDPAFFDWKWIEVKPDSQINLDFTLDFAQAGDLEVTLPQTADMNGADIIPLDSDGKLPEFKGEWEHMGSALRTHVRPQNAKVIMKGLRAGKYRVMVGKATVDVEVKAGMTVKSELKLP
jgi:hypothetical protein